MKIFDWLYCFKQRFKDRSVASVVQPVPTTQENPRDAQAVKRFNTSFDAQRHHLQSRAQVAHEMDCKDILACSGCFKVVADKIVGQAEVVSYEQVGKEMKKRRAVKKSVSK